MTLKIHLAGVHLRGVSRPQILAPPGCKEGTGIDTGKVLRYWKSGVFHKERFRKGWMPPHPAFFVKREIYERYGYLNLDFPLAADYELMLRFLYKYDVSTTYIPGVLVKMRTGGRSNPGLYTAGSVMENHRAWKVNGLKYPITVLMKPLSKIFQFFK